MEVDDNILLILGNPRRMLGHQLKPHPIHYLNIVIIFFNADKNRYYVFILF